MIVPARPNDETLDRTALRVMTLIPRVVIATTPDRAIKDSLKFVNMVIEFLRSGWDLKGELTAPHLHFYELNSASVSAK